MQRGVYGKRDGEDHQPGHDHRRGRDGQDRTRLQPGDEQGGNYGQENCPDPCGRHLAAEAVRTARHQRRGDGLNAAIGNGPDGEKAADLPEVPPGGIEENGQADDEPDVPRPEHEDARGGEDIDPGGLAEQFADGFRRFRYAEAGWQRGNAGDQYRREHRRHQPQGRFEPGGIEQDAADKKPEPLGRVL